MKKSIEFDEFLVERQAQILGFHTAIHQAREMISDRFPDMTLYDVNKKAETAVKMASDSMGRRTIGSIVAGKIF